MADESSSDGAEGAVAGNVSIDYTADQTVLEEADEDTLRVMLSTDNHLGYAERDPVRGTIWDR